MLFHNIQFRMDDEGVDKVVNQIAVLPLSPNDASRPSIHYVSAQPGNGGRRARGSMMMRQAAVSLLTGGALFLSGCAYRTRADIPAPPAAMGFAAYAARVEMRMRTDAAFLQLASDDAQREKLRGGAVLASSAKSLGIQPMGGTDSGEIQHWVGAVFVPRVTLARALPLLQDYGNRAQFMAPEIIQSGVLSKHGDELLVHLRIAENSLVSGVFDTTLRIRYRHLDNRRLAIDSRSEDVSDIHAARGAQNEGLLRALNHYWRIAETDDGIYLECEALVLSRRPPSAMQWLADPLIAQAAQKTLVNTLLSTKHMLESARIQSVKTRSVNARESKVPRSPVL